MIETKQQMAAVDMRTGLFLFHWSQMETKHLYISLARFRVTLVWQKITGVQLY